MVWWSVVCLHAGDVRVQHTLMASSASSSSSQQPVLTSCGLGLLDLLWLLLDLERGCATAAGCCSGLGLRCSIHQRCCGLLWLLCCSACCCAGRCPCTCSGTLGCVVCVQEMVWGGTAAEQQQSDRRAEWLSDPAPLLPAPLLGCLLCQACSRVSAAPAAPASPHSATHDSSNSAATSVLVVLEEAAFIFFFLPGLQLRCVAGQKV